MTVNVRQTNDGVVVSVKAIPGAKKNEIRGEHDGAIKIAVSAPPEKGKANDAVIQLLAKELGLSKHQLQIVAGHTSRNKSICITGAGLESILNRLNELLKSCSKS